MSVSSVAPPAPIASGPFTARQTEILGGLERLFLEEGFRAFTVGDLAQRLHCSRRTLYDLATSKDELVLVVLDGLLQRMGRQARDRVTEHDDSVEKVRAFIDGGVSEIRSASHTFAEDVAEFPAARRLFDAHYEYATEVLRRIIEEGIDRGTFRPVNALLVAQVFDAAIERLQSPRVLQAIGMGEGQAFTELTAMVLDGIGQRRS